VTHLKDEECDVQMAHKPFTVLCMYMYVSVFHVIYSYSNSSRLNPIFENCSHISFLFPIKYYIRVVEISHAGSRYSFTELADCIHVLRYCAQTAVINRNPVAVRKLKRVLCRASRALIQNRLQDYIQEMKFRRVTVCSGS
jgi:hypothetical protein